MTSRIIPGFAKIAAPVALAGLLLGCNNGSFQALQPLHEETRTTKISHTRGKRQWR